MSIHTQGRHSLFWLLARFTIQDIWNRFAGSVLGGFWALVHPLAMLGIYTFVFTAIMKVRMPHGTDTPFVVFLAVVLWPWMAFNEAIQRGTAAVVTNAALVKKVRFNHQVVVFAAATSSYAIHGGGYLLVLMILYLAGQPIHGTGVPLLLLAQASLAAVAVGLGLLLGAVHVFVRDLEHALGHALAILFYLCPILYSTSMLPDWLQGPMAFNPLATLIDATRSALLEGRMVPTPRELAAVAFAIVVLMAGRAIFRRLSPHFEEAL